MDESPAPRPYTIVLASKVSKKNAERFAQTLRAGGFAQAEAHTKGKTTRVIYGRYATEAEAYNALGKLNDHAAMKDGWVMKINEKP